MYLIEKLEFDLKPFSMRIQKILLVIKINDKKININIEFGMVFFNTFSNNKIWLETILVKLDKVFKIVIVLLKMFMNTSDNLIEKNKIEFWNKRFDISVRNTMKNLLMYKTVDLLKTKLVVFILIIEVSKKLFKYF